MAFAVDWEILLDFCLFLLSVLLGIDHLERYSSALCGGVDENALLFRLHNRAALLQLN